MPNTVTVNKTVLAASTAWTDLGITICPGDESLVVEASGTATWSTVGGFTSGPAGLDNSTNSGYAAHRDTPNDLGDLMPRYGLVLLVLQDGLIPVPAPNPLDGGDPAGACRTENITAPGAGRTYDTNDIYHLIGVQNGTMRVWAIFNDDKYSDNAGSFDLTLTVTRGPVLGPPDGFASLGICEGPQATLSWDEAPVNGYILYRDGEVLETLPGDATGFVDTGLTIGQTYTYRLSQLSCPGESALSDPIEVTPCVPEGDACGCHWSPVARPGGCSWKPGTTASGSWSSGSTAGGSWSRRGACRP